MPVGEYDVLEASALEPSLELISLEIRRSWGDELVEDDSVVLAETEIRDARHVLLEREASPDRRLAKRSIDALGCAMESDRKRPCKCAQV